MWNNLGVDVEMWYKWVDISILYIVMKCLKYKET